MITRKGLLLLLLLFLCMGCSGTGSANLGGSGQATFYLSELPDLDPFEIPSEITSRYEESVYVDALKPADDYGKLFPYEGARHSSGYGSVSRYGLVDRKGRIVVDPVYENAYYLDADCEYLCMVYPKEMQDGSLYDSQERGSMIIARADGSWVSRKYAGDRAQLSEDRIIISSYGSPESYEIYDLEGKLLVQDTGSLYGFSEGLGAAYHFDPKTEKGWYRFVDRDGNIVLPGPYLEARDFERGAAFVVVGDNWHDASQGLIDEQGNAISPFSAVSDGGKIYRIDENKMYNVFANEDGKIGIMDENGAIILPAEYRAVYPDAEAGIAIALTGEGLEGDFYIINLHDMTRRKVEGNVINLYSAGGGWCAIEKGEDGAESNQGASQLLLVKGDREYSFACKPGELWIFNAYIKDDLFALSYSTGDRQSVWTEFFDGATGKVVKRLDGWHFSHEIQGKMYLFYSARSSRLLLLNDDIEPYFPEGTIGANEFLSCSWLADDVYRVSSTFYSGLIRKDGQWLIRVHVNPGI